MDKDDILIIAVVSFCVIGLLVLTTICFAGWWCYVKRKEKQHRNRQNRKMEHLKYLEEYSIRTEDDEEEAERNNLSTPQITPRSDVTAGYDSVRDESSSQAGVNDSGYVIDDWEPHKVDHSTSFEASNASTVVSAYKKSSTTEHNNNVYSSDNHAYEHVDPEHGTNLDDVRL